jgi:transcriptional repressor NrdR
MVCIYCDGTTSVTNSRKQKRSNAIWRRRSCKSCEAIFTTLETIDYSTAIIVSSSGQHEAFSRDKLFVSVYESCKHQKDAQTSATMLTDTIIKQLYPLIKDASLSVDTIHSITLQTLLRFDEAAGVHYKAYHPDSD